MKRIHVQKRVYIFIAVILVVILFAIRVAYAPSGEQSGDSQVEGIVSLRGTSTCLPHIDTSGPQTLECAIGLKTEDGKYYALAGEGSSAITVSHDKIITVKGTLRKETSKVYQSQGTITVSEILK